MASIIATTGLPNRAVYAASKGAVLALTRSTQVDYGPLGIRVNALLPGTIFTPLLDAVLKVSFPSEAEALAAIRSRQLTDAPGRPEDVAKAALFLAWGEAMAEHAEILEAFLYRDPDGAEAAMRRHLSRAVELLHHEADLIERNGVV
jgi:NAD(P)-dependent dehydrogenase (short-subunit alcohol dehydrogenase family)